MPAPHPAGLALSLLTPMSACLMAALAAAFVAWQAAPVQAAPVQTVETGRPYLKQPAETPASLLRQVAADQQLTARYMKHFDASAPVLRRALQNARPVTLPPGVYTVWLTGRDGLRYPTVQARERETRAFLLPLPFRQDKESWLESGTGNPLQVFRPVEEVEVVVETPPARIEEEQVPREVLVPVRQASDPPRETDIQTAP